MEIQDIVPVEWQNSRVLLTSQLAEYYGCSVKQIKQNFNNNKDHFVAGKHYFKLEGDMLKKFRSDLQVDEIDSQNLQVDEIDSQNLQVDEIDSQNLGVKNLPLQISPKTRTLYLWTARGCARHAKMLSTDKAWEVYEKLEDTYFYVIANKTIPIETIPVPVKKNRRPLSPTACVYAFDMSNNTVKLGHSDNVNERKGNIKSKYKLTVKRIHKTLPVPREIARSIEKACQKIFSSYKLGGEFFSVDFETACKVIDTFVEFVNELPLISKFERADKLLTIADKLESSPERKTILIDAATIFVGKNLE